MAIAGGGTAVSPWRSNPKLRAVAAAAAVAFSIGAAGVVRWLFRWYARYVMLQRRRKARLESATGHGGASSKIIHCVFGCTPELDMNVQARLGAEDLAKRMNFNYPGIEVALKGYGSKAHPSKPAFLSAIGKPDMSCGFSHVFFCVADDTTALKIFLHSNLHKHEWGALLGPHVRPPFVIEMDTELAIDVDPQGKEDPILQIVFLTFLPHVTDDSDLYLSFEETVAAFNKFHGISASLRGAGSATLVKEDLREELVWSDGTQGMTHTLLIAADSPEALKVLHASQEYASWLQLESPHLHHREFPPAAIIMYCPVAMTANSR